MDQGYHQRWRDYKLPRDCRSRKIFIFWVYKAQMHLLFGHYFNFLSDKTNINKSGLNLINLEESEALKRHIPAT